jgi:hypothetical protein
MNPARTSTHEARPTPDGPARPWCLFRCGSEAFAIALESVAEIVEVERLVGLPHSPPGVLGLCTLRREVVPVIALGGPWPDDATAEGAVTLVLILKAAAGLWALRVSAEGTAVAEEPLEVAGMVGPTSGARGGVQASFLGTVRRGDSDYAVIDPEVTWRGVRESIDQWHAGHWGRDNPSRPSFYPPITSPGVAPDRVGPHQSARAGGESRR